MTSIDEQDHGKDIDLVECHHCHHVMSLPADQHLRGKQLLCSRCKSRITHDRSHSLQRTTAFLIAAFVLYFPANIYPIMKLVSFGEESRETIISGVLQLIATGQIGIAIVVFMASIFVPIFKIATLGFLVGSVYFNIGWRPVVRTKLYRFVEWIGRWSMIDIFMISVLIALVKLKALATVEAGVGALAFAAVIILTMFAANSFDPKLIWEKGESRGDDRGE